MIVSRRARGGLSLASAFASGTAHVVADGHIRRSVVRRIGDAVADLRVAMIVAGVVLLSFAAQGA
jgi:hypothetical protein